MLDKAAGIADARNKNDHIHLYVGQYSHCSQQQSILSKQSLRKTPTELRWFQRSLFLKGVNNQNLWKLELGGQESMNVSIGIVIGFQQRDRQDSQNLTNDIFVGCLCSMYY